MSGRRKILYVIDSFDRFGASWQLHLLSQGVALHHDVHIAVLGGKHGTPKLFGDDESRHFHFLAATSDLNARPSFRTQTRSGLRLRKLIDRLEPDLVHAWCQPAERITLAATANMESLRKVVSELYIRPSSNMINEGIDRQLGKTVERFVVSHTEVQSSLVLHGYDENRISMVASAISDPPMKINRESARQTILDTAKLPENTKIAGAVAPLVPRSRLKDTIWATDLLTCIRNDVHFFIFGSGSQRKRLERFASQTEAGHHIHFLDSQIDAMELIPGLDFFWQSHLNEPLPSAMHVAMACGVPVVSVFGPGTAETLRHQENAFVVNFGARDEFARWTKYLLEQTDSAQQLAQQGRASLDGKYPVDEMVRGYCEIYDVGF